MQFEFTTDKETEKLFEIVVEGLKRYFGHSETEAIALVNDFYLHSPYRLEDDWYHHDGAYATAARVHYYGFLNGADGGLDTWRKKEGYWDIPDEFMEYFRDHYYENDRPLIAELWKPKPGR